jgi:hypothetical protein
MKTKKKEFPCRCFKTQNYVVFRYNVSRKGHNSRLLQVFLQICSTISYFFSFFSRNQIPWLQLVPVTLKKDDFISLLPNQIRNLCWVGKLKAIYNSSNTRKEHEKKVSVKGHNNTRLLQVHVDEWMNALLKRKGELHSHTSIIHSSHTGGKESCPTNENQPTASLQTTYRCTIPTIDIETYRQTTKESPVMVGQVSEPVQTSSWRILPYGQRQGCLELLECCISPAFSISIARCAWYYTQNLGTSKKVQTGFD